MGIEIELKYRATPEIQRAVLAEFPQQCRTITMETTYYDTMDRQLSARRVTLRRRYENGESVCTLKTPAKNGARGEWDCLADTIEAAIPELCKLSRWEPLAAIAAAGLMPLCGARFTRLALDIHTDAFTAELALDQGILLGGGQEAPLCEIELELKSGDADAMTAYMQELAARHGLVPESKSKFRRAMALAEGA